MKYNGHGTIAIGDEEKRCSVELDIDGGSVIVRFANTDTFVSERLDFNKLHSIYNLNIALPTALIPSGKVSRLKLSDQSLMNSSVHESDLVQAFSLHAGEPGMCKLIFKPSQQYIPFTIEHLDTNTRSELVFTNTIISPIGKWEFDIGRSASTLAGEKNILILRSDASLFRIRNTISNALSLLQRGRICLLATQQEKYITLNFKSQGQVQPAGRLFPKNSVLNVTFLKKYISYENKLKGNEKIKFHRFVDYTINGCASLESLENQLISLYTALEIIDNSRTLNKTSLRDALKIKLSDAEIAVKIRNSLIHNGANVGPAIQECIAELRSRGVAVDSAWYSDTSSGSKNAKEFHKFLLDKIIRYIFATIGIVIQP